MQPTASRLAQHVNLHSHASMGASPPATDDDTEPKHRRASSRDKGKARDESAAIDSDGGEDAAWCLICHTSPIDDRTVLPQCLHAQFCFACILRWIGIKRKCPLCQSAIGDYVIHAVRADDDYVRYHLPPTLSTTTTDRRDITTQVQHARTHRRTYDSTLARRKRIYRLGLYAAHVGANRHTHYRACPTPAHIRRAATHPDATDLVRRITAFVRRELHVWPHVDVEFVTRYVLSLLQVFGVSDDETVRLVGEFLGEREARHLMHELECFLRSGKRDVRAYDESKWLQYREWKRERREEVDREEEETSVREEVAKRRSVLLDRLESERALFAARRGN
ncbi:uncharacterized protein SRS1_16570 [Sporisorium reilianum f. sp. reilianum]|uniref:RING-type E3 ubiquitin transferase n=1 Tax=Sporisorium reilianum f. sp. reilianum TaxID=72559 RepID=A0A2N8UE69_9BASI|nr:uncharacterized protein SRS1_16570 [Sporisorium reilianum f. sp. reilianum]